MAEQPPTAPRPHLFGFAAPLAAALRDRYEIIREAAQGVAAIVYIARDLKHDRLVAIKILNPDVSPVAGERFLREIQVSAGMQHPHILPMYDSGVADGRLYFVMPFVDGGSLRQKLEATPQLPLDDALRIAQDIAMALAFAHDQGVIHRDIKPENILFYHDHACLADFGVARVMEEMDVRVTGHGMIVGTPAYMSPEQLSDGGFDGRSDVYSLACVLYEMIAGVHVFSGSTPAELLRKRLRQVPRPVHELRADTPQFVDDLLCRALSVTPDDRFPDARAFADALEFTRQHLAEPPRRISAPRRALEKMPRHPLAMAGSMGLLVAIVALAASPIRSAVRNHGNNGIEASTSLPASAGALLRTMQQIQLDRHVDSDQFRIAAARLAAVRTTLHGRDSLRSEGLLALAARAFPQACDAYSRLLTSDSLDASAWFGLGDCHSLDSMVVRDSRSPSGWTFRSSWYTAAHAYMRAATIDANIYKTLPYALLTTLLPTDPTYIRFGFGAPGPTPTHGAYPSLLGDTVAYVPFLLSEFGNASRRTLSPTLAEVMRRNAQTLIDFARQWVATTPASAAAYEALALAYESRGELSDDDGAGNANRLARSKSSDADQQVRLAAATVRVQLKRGQFKDAESLADSVIDAWNGRPASRLVALRLTGLAALTGRVDIAARYSALASAEYNGRIGVAQPVAVAQSRLLVGAALGVCGDSLRASMRSIDQLLESYSQPAQRASMRTDLVGRAAMLAYPCLGSSTPFSSAGSIPLTRAQVAADARRIATVRLILDSIAAARIGYRPGDVSLDYTVAEASLRASIGDTAAAIRQLDLVLNALPTLGTKLVREEAQAGAVGHALSLRAELAAGTGDIALARTRATAALQLWRRADPSLSPEIDRLRAVAGTPRG